MLRRREAPVERHQDQPAARRGEQQPEHVRVIEPQPGDAVAAAQAQLAMEHRRGPLDAVRELGVGERLALEANGGPAGKEAGMTFDPK